MKKILVIDDEAIVRLSCERALVSENYEVKTADGGNEGINMLEKESNGLNDNSKKPFSKIGFTASNIFM